MYPAMLNIIGKRITIVGGGKVAYRKTKAFLECGGKVRIISPALYEKFETLKEKVQWDKRTYIEADLKESFIVVAATDDTEVNQAIGKYCEHYSILCNVIDDRQLSSFIVPAYMKQGDLTISISTNGKSPSLAKEIKKDLSEKYDSKYIAYLDTLGRIRAYVLDNYSEEDEKKRILQYVITLSLEELKAYEQDFLKG